MEFTKGEGCGHDGDYLSWDKMRWNLNGGAKIEHIEAEEACSVQPFNYYRATFAMKSCMHFCQNLGRGRAPPVTSLLQWERLRSFASEKEMGEFGIWVPINDAQHEGEWRDFYNHQALNFTPTWGKGEPNGGTTENCAVAIGGAWMEVSCREKGTCLCQRQPSSFHMRLRGLCTNSAIGKYYQPMHYAAISM